MTYVIRFIRYFFGSGRRENGWNFVSFLYFHGKFSAAQSHIFDFTMISMIHIVCSRKNFKFTPSRDDLYFHLYAEWVINFD